MKTGKKYERFFEYLIKRGNKKHEDKEFKEFKDLHDRVDQIEVPRPSAEMKDTFNQQIENLKNRQLRTEISSKKIFLPGASGLLKVAAAVVLIIAGITLGIIIQSNLSLRNRLDQLSGEIGELRKNNTLAVLSEPTASVKLEAIYNSGNTQQADKEIIQAFYNTLLSDDNPTVRLAAAQALGTYVKDNEVKLMLIDALEIQSDPMVQITLINILSSIKHKETKNALQNFVNKEDIDVQIKEYAREKLTSTSI